MQTEKHTPKNGRDEYLTRNVPIGEVVSLDPKHGLLANARTVKSKFEDTVKDPDELLAKDILENGLLQPIIVSPLPKGIEIPGAKYFTIAGHRRLYAHKYGIAAYLTRLHDEELAEAKKKAEEKKEAFDPAKFPKVDLTRVPTTIECKILQDRKEVDIAAINLRENYHKADLHWTDRASKLLEMKKANMTLQAISDVTGIPISSVGLYATCAEKLLPEIWAAARGETSGTVATQRFCVGVCGMTPEAQKEKWDALVAKKEGRPAADSGEDPPERVVRPNVAKQEKVLEDLAAKGYDHMPPDWRKGVKEALIWTTGAKPKFRKSKIDSAAQDDED